MRNRLCVVVVAAALALGVSAGVLAAGNSDPGIDRYHPQGSDCGQMHGSFGYFGKDLNLEGGANGQATGANNSAKLCQRNL